MLLNPNPKWSWCCSVRLVPLTKAYSNSALNRFGASAFSGEAEGEGVTAREEVGEGEGVAGVCVGEGCGVDEAEASVERGGAVGGVDGWRVSVFMGWSVGLDAGSAGWLTTMADATVIREHVKTTAITMTVLFIAINMAEIIFA